MNKQQPTNPTYQIGDVIQTTESFGPNVPGSIGVVYETYPNPVEQSQNIVSVMLTNGHDIGCFTTDEQAESLMWLGHTHLTYTYGSPGQLMADFRGGVFQQVFEQAQEISQQDRVALAEMEI